MKISVLNLDVRETQTAAIRLYKSMGFVRWGAHPGLRARRQKDGSRGFYYYKLPAPVERQPMKRLTLYPAIDLKDGACVRLARGDMDRATLYAADPAAQALAWQEVGCAWLHVVDLNGAFAGRPVNADAVRAILSAVSIPVQLGGGIRNMDTIAMWLDGGVSRVILGSAAVRDPALVPGGLRALSWPYCDRDRCAGWARGGGRLDGDL